MRLDRLYAAGAALAAVFMVLIAALTLAQVAGRLFGVATVDAGEISGYAMAASIFLALAHTFRTGGHIRVNLLLTHVPARWRRALEYWCLGALAVVAALFSVYAVSLVVESRELGDVSTGMIPVPLWIPQISMAAGAILLEIAVLDEWVNVLRGNTPRYETRDGGTAHSE